MFKNLFDFSYERDLYEAFAFYVVYLFILGYLFIGVGLATFDNIDPTLLRKALILTITAFCGGISVGIMFSKNLKDPKSLFLIGLSFILAFNLEPIISIYLGLIPTTFLTMMEDKTAEPEIELNEKLKMEKELDVEKTLEREGATRRRIERESKSAE